MDLSREIRMQELRKRIAQDDYPIDSHAVADAIVARLIAGAQSGEPDDGDRR
jgi:anti-sigma28 factor (negative regulator of flagellin synthesis)